MRHLLWAVLLGSCLMFVVVSVSAQADSGWADNAVRQLLARPVKYGREKEPAPDAPKRRAEDFYDAEKPPPDDAPIEDLLDYWSGQVARRSGARASLATQERLLMACGDKPEQLTGLLNILADNAANAERVKKIWDAAVNNQELDADWRKEVRSWLVFHSPYFLNELTTLARKAKDRDSYVDNEEALNALAQQDWETARPLLQSFATGAQPRTAAAALNRLYRHASEAKESADEEKYRAQLRTVVADRNAPARARDTACDALSLTEWPGQDDWYLSLFEDETLREPNDHNRVFSPLSTLFHRNPKKWIPVISKLIGNKNRAVHSAAGNILVGYVNSFRPSETGDPPPREAILPVLPWLSDPDWMEYRSSSTRAWFMQHMDELDIPESVPGLIWIVENDESDARWAARTLMHYKDPRAVPALRKALEREANEDDRKVLIECLIVSGGVTTAEMVDGLEAYVAKISTPQGRVEIEKFRNDENEPLPLPISIGHFLSGSQTVSEDVALQVLERVKKLQKTRPALAKTLLEIAQGWKGRLVDLDLLRRIASNRADAETIASALMRREALRESVKPELYALLGQRGMAQGVGAALLSDEAAALEILGGKDAQAQAALLASARLTNQALPVETVGALLPHADKTLSLAAEGYLLQEDSPAAQQILWTHHKDKAFITGWRENIPQIGGSDFDQMSREEEKLRAELLAENGPQEIYAVLVNSTYGHSIVRVYPNKATYTVYENNSSFREVSLSGEALKILREAIVANKLIESGPQFSGCHYDCGATEFVFLTLKQGRRVFSHGGFGGLGFRLGAMFSSLKTAGPGKIHYFLAEEIKGLEILFADKASEAKAIWQQGAELRVLAQKESNQETDAKASDDEENDDDDTETLEAKRKAERKRRAAQERARYSWRTLANGKLGPVVAAPPFFFPDIEQEFEVDEEFDTNNLAQARAGEFVILSTDFNGPEGLWKKARRQKAAPITSEGKYGNVVTTPDGQWAIAAKADEDWSGPNQVMRVNLRTGREFQVKLPPAQNFRPLAYLAAHGKVLLYRARDDNSDDPKNGPDAPEYYLLDAATGRTELVKGNFAPLEQIDKRPLQPTGKPDEFWAALPDADNNKTQIGRYSARSFTFQPVLLLPHITFDSMGLWVDEANGKVYVTYDGQLLRLPLLAATSANKPAFKP